MKRALLLCLALTTIGSGCATQYDSPIGVPDRPYLIPITVELQVRIPVDALDIIAINQATLKNHIQRLEQRIILHDESL